LPWIGTIFTPDQNQHSLFVDKFPAWDFGLGTPLAHSFPATIVYQNSP